MPKNEQGHRPSTICAAQSAHQCTVEQSTLWHSQLPRMKSSVGAGRLPPAAQLASLSWYDQSAVSHKDNSLQFM